MTYSETDLQPDRGSSVIPPQLEQDDIIITSPLSHHGDIIIIIPCPLVAQEGSTVEMLLSVVAMTTHPGQC